MTTSQIIAFLRASREEAGLSADEVANRIGVDRTTLLCWERELREIKAHHLALWCHALGMELSMVERADGAWRTEGCDGMEGHPQSAAEVLLGRRM